MSIPDLERGSHDGTVDDPEPRRDPPVKSKPNRKRRGFVFFPDEPPFRVWLRVSWIDLLLQFLCMAASFILDMFVRPLPTRYFTRPPTLAIDGGGLVNSVAIRYGYPLRKEYIPTWMSAVISFFGPVLFILIHQIFWRKRFWDCDSAIMGISYAITTATLFQVSIKYLIGGFRPNFYAVCKPSIPPSMLGDGYNGLYYTRSYCTGNPSAVNKALSSFPSGHSTAAFAGFVFLALYINAHFKVIGPNYTGMGEMLLFSLPILIACLIALSKWVDYWHHWYDVLAGGLIGTFFAVVAYLMVYEAVLDWKVNDKPKLRDRVSQRDAKYVN